ncbi:CHAT domain-containing protein [Parachaetomium inaequale]|uniref:CHAT domain-containing protein n=1 Tax=Parachaetomium inaequale TaxID=2588326 RepID=A0AAN6P4R0_9PEZI|nr:CHAT domain-containing protein [Parachaetomium inaequale]
MRTYYLKALEGLLRHRYTTNRDANAQVPLDDMEAALRYGNLALLGPDTDQGRAEYLSHIAQLCWAAFQAGGDVAFVEQAIRHLRSGLEIRNGADSYDRAIWMMNVSEFSWALFQKNQAPELLDQSISAGQDAAKEDPTAVTCDFWHKLSWRLKLRHEASGSVNDLDLDEAIKSARRAVELAPDNHPARPSYLKNLASRLTSKYLATKSGEDLEAVINANRAAVDAAPPGSTVRAETMNNLGLTLFYRFERDSSLGDLDECVQLLKESVALSPPPDEASLPSQAEFYGERFLRERSLPDLDLAISIQTFVVENTSSGHPDRGVYCANLAAWLHARYKATHAPEDIDKAIEFGLLAVKDEPRRESEMAGRHSNLAVFYASRWEAQGNASDGSDLEQAIFHRRNARKRNREKEEDYRKLGISLADDLHRLFRLHAERRELDEAIGLLQEAVESSDCSEDRVILLNNLSCWYVERYHVFGSQTDLGPATRMARAAVEACQDCPQHLPSVRFGLAQALYFKFEVTCQVDELQSAIEIVTEICDGEPSAEDEDTRPFWLASLGRWLCLRGAMTLDSHDLNESVRMCRKAIASQPRDSSRTAFLLRNLGHALGMRYQHTGQVQDVEEAIAMVGRASRIESAAKSTRALSDEFNIPDGLDELGTLYFCRFNALGARRDLDESVRLGRDSLDTNTKSMFRGHPRRCQALVNLGNRYGLHYLRFGDATSLLEAISHTQRALEEEEAAGTDNIVLPLLAPQSIERDDQEDALRQIGNLSSSAAAAAIQAGKEASFALLQLEAGRGVISSLLIRARSDISRLEAVRPDMAERYETLRSRCARLHHTEGSGTTTSPSGSRQPGLPDSEDKIGRIQEDLRELAVLEHTIRGVTGFEDFQSRLSIEQIKRLASSGTLVSFNVSKWGSHAFYVTKEKGIGFIPLPDLAMADVQSNLQLLVGKERLAFGTPSSRPARNKQLCDILTWLWSAAVAPVLGALDLMSPADAGRLPRLFWVASGPIGSMPIHAAGDFRGGAATRVSKYVVSTYVPTLNSLDYARKLASRRKHSLRDLQTLITTGQEPSPGSSSRALNVQQEIAAVQNAAAAAHAPAPKVSTATLKTEILQEVEGHTIVHFACHGKSCPDRPSDSGLFVGVGEDPDVPPLRVRDLAALSYGNARLAFLSACSTAEISAQSLVDEAMHVASAFQIAGFPHVIGTLWEAEDRATIALAVRFYEWLFHSLGSSREWDDDAVAYALHDAVEALKSEGVPGSRRRISLHNDPLVWAPFIHIGI